VRRYKILSLHCLFADCELIHNYRILHKLPSLSNQHFLYSKLFLVLILLVRCVCVAIAIQPLVKQPGALITIFFRSDLIALHSFKTSFLQQRVLERARWISEILFKFKVKYLSRYPFHQKRRRH
jgi:hypothetical protein